MTLSADDEMWLIRTLVATSELLGRQITGPAAALLAEDLSVYPRQVLARALARVRKEHTGALTPKAILDRIEDISGRPSPNEAWATAVTALDEFATVVWTEEMRQAWGVVSALARAGDLVGARMSFMASYERQVRLAREEGRPVVVHISEGFDGRARTAAIELATQRGYLSPAQASEWLQLQPPSTTMPPALLLGFSPTEQLDLPEVSSAKERLLQMRADLRENAQRRHLERTHEADARRRWLAEVERQRLEKVEAYARDHGIPLEKKQVKAIAGG